MSQANKTFTKRRDHFQATHEQESPYETHDLASALQESTCCPTVVLAVDVPGTIPHHAVDPRRRREEDGRLLPGIALGCDAAISVRVSVDFEDRLVIGFRPVSSLRPKAGLKTRLSAEQCANLTSHQPMFSFVNTNGSRLVRSTLADHGLIEVTSASTQTQNPQFDLLWTGKHIKRAIIQYFGPFQKINHFPRSFEITRKDRMFKNVDAMRRRYGDTFHFLPKTYVLPEEHVQLRKRLRKTAERWILKPNSSSRGRGIFIVKDLLDITQTCTEKCVVCRYIPNPLLIHGHKFDLRIYCLVTSFNPLRVYIFEEGLARFATERYKQDSYKNPFIHLTNYSINKKSQKFSLADEEQQESDPHGTTGNKWTLTAFRNFLVEMGIDEARIMTSIHDVITKAMISVESTCRRTEQAWVNHRGNCYELFGVDVLLDEDLKPWILEFNLSPSLSVDSMLDFIVKRKMISDLFSIIGVSVYDSNEYAEWKESAQRVFKEKQRAAAAATPQQNPPLPTAGGNGKVPETQLQARDFFRAIPCPWGRPVFGDNPTDKQLAEMVAETQGEYERRGGWVMTHPARTDCYDEFFPEANASILKHVRSKLKW